MTRLTNALVLLSTIAAFQPLIAAALPCAGDCDQNGVVRVNELIRLVKAVQEIPCPIAPYCPPPDPCLGLDVNGDGMISTNELIAGVNRVVEAVGNGLNGCPRDAAP